MTDKQTPKPNQLEQYPIWVRMLLFFLLWMIISYGYMTFWQDRQIEEISYSQFKTDIQEDRVASIEMTGSKVVGTYLSEREETGETTGELPQQFRTVVPSIDDSVPDSRPLRQNGLCRTAPG